MTRVDQYTYEFYDGNWKKETIEERWKETNILPRDSSAYMLYEKIKMFGRYHTSPKPGSRHPDFQKYRVYFVSDGMETPLGATAHEFTRTWVSLPGYDASGKVLSDANIVYQQYTWTIPGLGPSAYQDRFLQWDRASFSNTSRALTVVSTSPHDIVAGNLVMIAFNVTDPLNHLEFTHYTVKKALPGTAGSTLVTEPIFGYSNINVLSFKRSDVSQTPFTRNVQSRITKKYYLVGENIPSVSDIPVVQPFRITTDKLGVTDTLTPDTTPTVQQYFDYVSAKTWIPAEQSTFELWKGEIYEWTLREVQATI